MSADDIRKSIALLESSSTNVTNLEEAPMGLLKTLVTGASALFSDVAAGELQAGQAANKWYASYMQYLGKTGKKPNTSTIGDLFTFLVDNGIKPQAVFGAVTKGMGDARVSIKNMDDVKKFWNTAITTDPKGKISKTLLYAMQNHVKSGAADQSPEELMKQARTGSQIAAQAEKGAQATAKSAGTTATPVSSPDESKPRLEVTLSDNTPTALAAMVKSDPSKAAQTLDKLLKSLGA
jgi:hypothetical protein